MRALPHRKHRRLGKALLTSWHESIVHGVLRNIRPLILAQEQGSLASFHASYDRQR